MVNVSSAVRAALRGIHTDILERAQSSYMGEDDKGAKDMHITNIVSLCDYGLTDRGLTIPLEPVARHLYAKYSNAVFPAVISHCRETGFTHSLFTTGSCICTGAQRTEDSNSSLMLLSYALNQFLPPHYYTHVTDFAVTNIVAACRLGRPVDMDELTSAYQHNGGAPRKDVFPGYKVQIYKLKGSDEWTDRAERKPKKSQGDLSVTFIIFDNGKVNATGISHEEDIPAIEDELYRLLDPYVL
jgi:TATA-box binding protein (TBP) (component of TFIID and TFIIIB)